MPTAAAGRNSNRRLLRSLFTHEREMPENAKLFYSAFHRPKTVSCEVKRRSERL